jgi:lipid-A-disaccharide synthase
LDLNSETKFIGLFPGSRVQEIKMIFPEMIASVRNASLDNNKYKVVVGCAPGITDDIYRSIGGNELIYARNITYDLMTHSELNLVASGTATLECAMLGGPLFVLYKTSPITYLIAKKLIKIPYVGLVNVVARKKIAPEFIQGDCNGEMIGKKINEYLSQPSLHNLLIENVKNVKNKLGQPGASEKTARLAISMIESNSDK